MTVCSQNSQIGNDFGKYWKMQFIFKLDQETWNMPGPFFVWLHDYVQAWLPIITEGQKKCDENKNDEKIMTK